MSSVQSKSKYLVVHFYGEKPDKFSSHKTVEKWLFLARLFMAILE